MKIKFLIWILVVIMSSVGCNPSNCVKGTIDFELPSFALSNPPNVMPYSTNGEVIYTNASGPEITIKEFSKQLDATGAVGTGFNSGVIMTNPIPSSVNAFPSFGTNQFIHLIAADLVFRWPTSANIKKVQFDFLNAGVFTNLAINDLAHIELTNNISNLPNNLNGITVKVINVKTVRNAQGVRVAEFGQIIIESSTGSPDILGIVIGGDEWYLDNFCFN